MMVLMQRLALVVALALLLAIVVIVTNYFRGESFETRYPVKQLECLAAAARADAVGESRENQGLAQESIIDAHLRYVNTFPSVSLCDALENVLLVYPPKWEHPITFRGRSLHAIKNSPLYGGAAWDEAFKRAIDGAKKGFDRDGCRIYYGRETKGYSWFTNEEHAAATLEKMVEEGTLRRDPKQPAGLKMKFYCLTKTGNLKPPGHMLGRLSFIHHVQSVAAS